MDNTHETQAGSDAIAEQFGSMPNRSEDFRKLPNLSETFRTVPNPSASFGNVPHVSEPFRTLRKESHTITVREAARMFESAGVARTERSIVNWCRENATGIARLDAYFEPNERRYYISQQSIESAIAEEKAKAFRNGQDSSDGLPNASEPPGKGETHPRERTEGNGSPENAESLRQELLNLKILNSGKDFYIQRLTQERDGFIQQLVEGSKKIGQLENQLLQIEGRVSKERPILGNVPKNSEAVSEEGFADNPVTMRP